jgi:hypothetical protein
MVSRLACKKLEIWLQRARIPAILAVALRVSIVMRLERLLRRFYEVGWYLYKVIQCALRWWRCL